MEKKLGFLCLTCEFKGIEFIRQVHRSGHKVYLVTSESRKEDPWPKECIEEFFFMSESDGRNWSFDDLRSGTAYLMRSRKIDRIIALDDYEVSKAAFLREEFRMPGMGQTTARHFYDKLAMRIQAYKAGLNVPRFSALINDGDIADYFRNSEGPWFVKPRSDAGTIGIRKVRSPEEFWHISENLGDNRFKYLIEEYKPGTIFHVDSLSIDGKVVFTRASEYMNPPFNVAHGGGIFQSATLEADDPLHKKLTDLNAQVLRAFGMSYGASHSEFILHGDDLYFLETSARVGGANLSVLVEKASGVELWSEWAKIEIATLLQTQYQAPSSTSGNAGIIASLSRIEHPDYHLYQEPEIVWTLDKPYHIGFIFQHSERKEVLRLLEKYNNVIAEGFHAVLPARE